MNNIMLKCSRLVNVQFRNRVYNSQLCLNKCVQYSPISYHGIHTSNLYFKAEESKPPEKPKMEISNNSFVQKIYKKFFSGVPKSKLKASGFVLLTYCAQKSDLEEFFRVFEMPDTFYSWFLVTELHVWMLSTRLMDEGDYGRETRNAMVEALWQDSDFRAKSMGAMAASARSRQILSVSEEFQAALFIYDEGLLGGDKELANALWRRFFLSMHEQEGEETQAPDMEKIALLVNYVRSTMNMLDNTDAVTLIIKGMVDWVPLQASLNDK